MTIWEQILTTQECAERYKLNHKFVQHVIWKGERLKPGRDCCLKGNTWLILDSAASKLWGHRLIACPPGFRVCRKCWSVHPEDAEHFEPYDTKGTKGLMHVCRGCYKLQNAAWYQRNKTRLRPIRRRYSHHYRAAYPEREAVSQKRAKLKRALRRFEVQS